MVLESYTSIVCDPYNSNLENLLVVGKQFNLYKWGVTAWGDDEEHHRRKPTSQSNDD